eukprot:m.167811 g.167811  ORF g.167811 m.167811 type:complete len:285 (+) comp21138_c0_seq2:3-857(+)
MLVRELAINAASVAAATTLTHPADLVKVQLQIQQGKEYLPTRGAWSTAVQLVKTDGVVALWRGLVPSVVRGGYYGGIRLGLYAPLKQTLQAAVGASERGRETVAVRISAGLSAGVVACLLSHPLELVKIRMQADDGHRQRRGMLGWLRHIYQHEGGLTGLLSGIRPALLRAALLTGSQTVSYDYCKTLVAEHWRLAAPDSAQTHFAASVLAGLCTTTCTMPADVIKTRMCADPGRYPSIGVTLANMLRHEGLHVLLRGWVPAYLRLAPQTTLIFVFAEQLRLRW